MIRLLVCFFVLTASCFATGANRKLVAEMNGWTVTLSEDPGVEIEKRVADEKLHAWTTWKTFSSFWDCFYLAKTIPKAPKDQKSPFRIIEEEIVGEENPEIRVTVTYLAVESARPIFELVLLNYRAEFVSDDEATLMEELLNKTPPIDRRLILPDNRFVFKVSGKAFKPDSEPWLRESKAAEQDDASHGDKPSN